MQVLYHCPPIKRKRKLVTILAVRRSVLGISRGILAVGPLRLPCALGRSGLTSKKREGDGATPIGTMALLYGYRKPTCKPVPMSALSILPSRKNDGWCDSIFDANYNRPVKLPYHKSAERLLRHDDVYDICIVMNWNIVPRRQRAGSAIFFHLAHDDYAPTQGCVALSRRDMLRILPFLSAETKMVVLG